MISLIAAVGDRLEIGQKKTMPWHIPEDLQRFKALTLGKTMVMGKNTFLSLPGVLPGREHWIATRDASFTKEHPRVRILRDLDAQWSALAEAEEEYMIIGGGQIYAQALPYAARLYLTHVHRTYPDADTYFPAVDWTQWTITERSEEKTTADGLKYEFIDYVRRG
jgi:dihydrofolate reductase